MSTFNAQQSTLNIQRAASLDVERWTFFQVVSWRWNCIKHRYFFSCSKHSDSGRAAKRSHRVDPWRFTWVVRIQQAARPKISRRSTGQISFHLLHVRHEPAELVERETLCAQSDALWLLEHRIAAGFACAQRTARYLRNAERSSPGIAHGSQAGRPPCHDPAGYTRYANRL